MAFFMREGKQRSEHRIRHKMTEATEFPKDVVLGIPVLTAMGRTELCIENYRGIIEYTDTVIRIKTKIGQIKIEGKKLQVEYYTNDDMKITGWIHCIEYPC